MAVYIAKWLECRPSNSGVVRSSSGRGRTYMSRVIRKPTFCICENKDVDQLRGNREADRHLCFRYIDSTIPLRSKSEISMCTAWLMSDLVGNQNVGFLMTRLNYVPVMLRSEYLLANKGYAKHE